MDASEIYSKRLNAKEVIFPKEKGEFVFPVAAGRIKFVGTDQELRTSTLIRQRPIRGESHLDFLGEADGRVSSTTSWLVSRCRWSNYWLSVHVRKLHIPPSRWAKSQTLLTERRIILYSTEVHWRIQNYTYEFGCYARKPHRWLLEYRWINRFVWFLDRFHSAYSIKWRTFGRIFVVWGETDKTASDIQAWPFTARTLERNVKETLSWGRSKNCHLKNQSSIMQEDYEESVSLTLKIWSSRKSSKNARRTLETPNGSSHALQDLQEKQAWRDP